jgi:signal transduction histidine kinase
MAEEGPMAILPDRIPYSNKRNPANKFENRPADDVYRLKDENSRLESELHLTLEEIAHLQNAVANANMKLTALKNSSKKQVASEKREVSAITDELKEIYIPLNTISNYCDLLLSESIGSLGSLQQKFVERIVESTLQIRELLDGFQGAPTAPAPIERISTDSVDLHILLEQTLEKHSALLQKKQIVLQMEVPDELPKVTGQPDQLSEIIELMVVNALTVTPKDSSICITAFIEKILSIKKVTLKIRDGGPGIPAADLKRLFPYQRADNIGEIPGLSMKNEEFSRFINKVQKLGCKFKLSNAIGFGSIFEVTFDCSVK